MPSIGDVRVNFLADTAAFTRNTQKGEATLLKFGATAAKAMAGATAAIAKSAGAVLNLRNVFIGAAAAFATSKLVGSLHQAAIEVDKIGKAAHRLGMSVPQMSALKFAADQAGVSFEALSAMSSKALINVSKLAAAGQTSLKLGSMRVALTDAAGRVRSISDLLPDIAEGIKSANSAAEQLRLSQTIFGKGGADQFITFLQESGNLLEGLRGQTAMAGRLNILYTEEEFQKLKSYADAVGRLRDAWMGVKVKIMAEVAPALEKVADRLALQIAELPRVFTASIRALRQFAFGDEAQRDQAAKAIGEFKDSLVALLKGASVEMGKVLAVALVEATTIGFQAVGPTLSDVFRDALGPILNEIPGIDIAPSASGRLAQLRKNLDDAKGLRDEIDQIERDLEQNPYLDGQDRFRAETQLTAAHVQFRQLTGASLQSLQTQIAAQERMVALQAQWRRDATAASLAGGLVATDQAIAGMGGKLQELVDRWVKAKEALLAFSQPEPDATAAAGPTEGAKAIGEALATWKRLTASMAEGQARQGGTWGGFWDHLKGKVEEFTKAQANLEEQQDKLRASAQALAEEADPSLTLARRIAEMRELAAQFPEVLDPEKVSRLTQRWTADFEKMQEKARTFSQDMGDAIKGFAGSAGDAFARFALRAEGSMKDLLLSWTQTLVSMAATKLMFEPFFNAIGDAVGGATSKTPTNTPPVPVGHFPSGRRAAGAIIDGPTPFLGRKGLGLMGEAGPEAIMPLSRVGGALGVRAVGGGVTVNVIDQRSGGEQVQTRESRGPDGRRMVEIIVRDAVKGMAADGSLDKVLQGFGVKRRGTPR